MHHLARASIARRSFVSASPRERLLVAAATLFTRRGYAATSVREIVEKAGVTKPVLYYHFGNKEGIYRALVEQLLLDFDRRLEAARKPLGSARERITTMCTDLFELVQERLEIIRLFLAVFYGPPQSAPLVDLAVFPRRFRTALQQILNEGVEAGELRGSVARDAVTAIEAMVMMAVDTTLGQPDRSFNKEDLARLLDLLFTGLNPEKEFSR